MRILGLDEAGRGCVLGPLVVGGFCCDEALAQSVERSGATDSKALSRKKREGLIETLEGLGTPTLREVSAVRIDQGNLNTLEEEAFASIILELRPDHVIIDAPCNPAAIPNFQRRLEARLDYSPSFRIQPKADADFPIVGAASIFAKVHRDRFIDGLGPVGSGYPSDPKTRAWLLARIRSGEPMPAFVRTRWGTLAKLAQQTLF